MPPLTLPFIFTFLRNHPQLQRHEAEKLVRNGEFTDKMEIAALITKILPHHKHDPMLEAFSAYREDERTVHICTLLYDVHFQLVQLQYFKQEQPGCLTHILLRGMHSDTMNDLLNNKEIKEFLAFIAKKVKQGRPVEVMQKSKSTVSDDTIALLETWRTFLGTFVNNYEIEQHDTVLPNAWQTIDDLVGDSELQ